MAKTGQSGSAAQRRAQERQQRQRREENRASALNKGKKAPGRGPTIRKKDRTGLYMGIGVVLLLAAIVVVFIIVRNQPLPTNTNPALKRVPADQTIVMELTNVPQSTWEAVGKGSVAKNAFTYNAGTQPPRGPNGHPRFLYVGGEFCPYCAAQRWAMINALSRFGAFSNLSKIQAYEGNVPTFSFYGSTYTSQYIDFVPKEVKGNALNADQTQYVDLEKLTADEQKDFQKYDSGQNFPYVSIGDLYTSVGAGYDFTALLDSKANPLSYQAIVSALSDPKSTLAQGMLGTANYMTAGICSLTNQQPGNVCNVTAIQQIEQAMSGKAPASTPGATATPSATATKTSQIPGGQPLASGSANLIAAQRRVLG
ncbi:MAG TPA: DUF929 family protein [Ktedonobacteraceae bacterium]